MRKEEQKEKEKDREGRSKEALEEKVRERGRGSVRERCAGVRFVVLVVRETCLIQAVMTLPYLLPVPSIAEKTRTRAKRVCAARRLALGYPSPLPIHFLSVLPLHVRWRLSP